MLKGIVYTTVFGGYDDLIEQNLPDGWDWICFSEKNSLSLYTDNSRNAKKFKILPHRYLQEYEYSIFIDGNLEVIGDMDELIDKYLMDCNTAFYNHNQAPEYDKRNCIYEEAKAIKWLYEVNPAPLSIKVPKDNLDIIQSQMDKYKDIEFPKNLGLIYGGVILRRHNELDCIKVMEDWWTEIKHGSKRDLLSFNYAAWKNKFKFNYINGNARESKYFPREKHNKHK